ncbi:hypothetical protein THOM_2713 [Trachipleistophora hominis]|uniref:Uncharacterized protein n=1 Tax=Trachipleistophora hominis TaxID=72359 RepID=L7JSS4_TRAHO|nr:hypothetical protein THOM_2713 [Trachipleistophora hominis]
MQPEYTENSLVTNPETRTTNDSGCREAAYTSTQANEVKNTHNRTIKLIRAYNKTHKHMFKARTSRLVGFKRLCDIINFTWCDCDQNRLEKFTTMLSNMNDIEIVEHFTTFKKLCIDFSLSKRKHLPVKALNKSEQRPMSASAKKMIEEYEKCPRHDNINGYIAQLNKYSDTKLSFNTKDKRCVAFKEFLMLIENVINVKCYLNPENADEVTAMEIRKFFFIIKKFCYNYIGLYEQKYHLVENLMNLFNNSLCIFLETRIGEKNIMLPEFLYLKDSFIVYCKSKSKILYSEKTFQIYIISRIEAAISKMIVLNNEIATSQDIVCENNFKLILYRSFVREVLLTNLLFSFQCLNRHISKYIFLSQLEYIYVRINVSTCCLGDNGKFRNFYDVLFWTLSDFYFKISFTKQNTTCAWDSNIDFSRINTNHIIIKLIILQPDVFKRALKKNIRRLFTRQGSRFAQLSRLKKTIWVQINSLNRKDPCLMLLKAHAIYKFLRCYLLANS